MNWLHFIFYDFYKIILGFFLILLIESVVHKLFGDHGHSHFPSQASLADSGTGDEVSNRLMIFL